jgi:hypothetical protein
VISVPGLTLPLCFVEDTLYGIFGIPTVVSSSAQTASSSKKTLLSVAASVYIQSESAIEPGSL